MSKLRYGIMINDKALQEWQLESLKHLERKTGAKLCVTILKSKNETKSSSLVSKFNKFFFFKAYLKFIVKPNSLSMQKRDITDLISTSRLLNVKTIKKGKYSEYFSDEDIETIKSLDLDFIVRFGFNIIRGEILTTAKYGIWSYHHDDPSVIRGGPPCFWEMYHSFTTTGSILQRLTDKLDGGIVLYEGQFPTHPFSYKKNLDQAYMESSKWLSLVAKKIQLNSSQEMKVKPKVTDKIFKTPTTSQFMYFLIKCLLNYSHILFLKLFTLEIWNVAISKMTIGDIIHKKSINEAKLQWLPKLPNGEFVADPFIYETEGNVKCLLEHFRYGGKGKISEVSNFKSKTYVGQEVINDNFHYSYPNIFSYKEELYFIPECFESRSLKLYKKVNDKWTYIKPLLVNVKIIDATLLYHNERYWFFCSLADQGPNVNLYIYSCDKLDGDYISHPLNPVKTDITSSRPAGSFIFDKGGIYRPAQNCSRSYGGSLIINKLEELSETKFSENFYCELSPVSDYPDGLHTLTYSENYIAIDGKKITFTPFAWSYKLKKKLIEINKKLTLPKGPINNE